MSPEALLSRARQAWTGLAGAAIDFPSHGVDVVASPGSRLGPSGWTGVVALGGAAIATVPLVSLVHVVREALAELSIASVTDPDHLRTKLPIKDVLGPASLAYLDEDDFRPAAGPAVVQDLSPEHEDLATLLSSVGAAEGLAQVVASAAVKDALRSRSLPQWRARREASRRVAENLGFSTLGRQLSIRVED